MDNRFCLKPKEAAPLVGVSAPVMYELCNRPDFPSIRVGRSILIPIDSLKAWLEKQATQGSATERE